MVHRALLLRCCVFVGLKQGHSVLLPPWLVPSTCGCFRVQSPWTEYSYSQSSHSQISVMARLSFPSLMAVLVAFSVASTMAQAPASSPSKSPLASPPKKIPAPAQSPAATTPTSAPSPVKTPPTSAPSPTVVTSPPSPSSVSPEAPASPPASIAATPSEAPGPAENSAVLSRVGFAGSLGVGVFAAAALLF